MSDAAAVPPADVLDPTGFSSLLLNLSVSGVMLMRPRYEADGEIVDFDGVRLNPAAQQMLRLPECPAESFRTLYPTAQAAGVFDFYREAFRSGTVARRQNLYQFDGLDGYYALVAQRYQDLLVVSFTDTNNQPRTPVEEALRESQAAEKAAWTEAEAERQRFREVLMRLPAQVAINRGPDHVFDLVNVPYQQMFPARPMQGLPVREALPELVGQHFIETLDHVYQTGEPFYGRAMPASVDFTNSGRFEVRYVDVFFHALRDAQGLIDGVLNFSYDVTEQVLARQQVEQLNATLEARVQARTSEAETARQVAELQEHRLEQLFLQAPAAICILDGPDLVYELVNPAYQQLFPGRALAGLPLLQALPELTDQPVWHTLQQVYRTGTTHLELGIHIAVARHAGGPLDDFYFNYIQQARFDAQGQVDGVVVFAFDVTEQILARQQVEQLNADLEARVQERTRQLTAAQAAAEHERARLQAVLAQAPVAIGLFAGEELRVTSANAAILTLWGRTPEQVMGRPLLEALPELKGQGFEDLLRQVLRTQVPYIGTETPAQLRRAGQLHTTYFNFVYQPLYEADGRVTDVLCMAVDVTAQVLARQQVEQLNQQLEARVQERTETALALQADLLEAAQRQVQMRESFYQVFEQTTAAVALLRGPHHRYEYVNAAYRGFAPHRPLVGGTIAEELPELYAQGFGALLDRVYQTGETYFGVELPFTPDPRLGEAPRTSYFNFTYQAYRENGEIAGVSIFAFEVTEQVLARQERDAQQRRLQTIFEQAPVAIFVLRGPTYILDVVNPPMSELLGRTPDELLGRPYFEAMPELATQGYAEFMDQVWHTGQPFAAREQPARLKRHQAGETGYFTFVYQPLFDARGQLTDIMCVALDETEQVRARQQVQDLNEELAAINEELTATNEELNESNTQLTRTNVDLDTFVYTASHDLKAPITNIESIVLALRDTLPAEVQQDELVAHLLDLLNQTVTRFRFTIGQLTDISRLQLAHAGPAEPVVLAPVVETVRLDMVPLLTEAGTSFTAEVPADLVVSFSPANLRSIVYNLLSNAVKYRAPDRPSRVRVHAARAAHGVVLTVQDNGLGMSEVQQRQLFGLFQRLHTHVEGTGVGLYITKRLVENAGGTIAVHSQPDAGTTFTISFPA